MSSFCHLISRMAVFATLIVSLPAHALIFNLNGTFQVQAVSGDDLTGLINPGDDVFVEAFYDTDLAQQVPGANYPALSSGYIFPEGAVGLRYTVNDLVWEAMGPMAVEVFNGEGSTFGPEGYPGWLAHTHPLQNAYLDSPPPIETPFGTESGVGHWMIYLPTFKSELLNGTELPTNLDVSQLAGPFYIHGAAAGRGPNGAYFFNFTSPIPEPETYPMLIAGLGLLSLTARRKKHLRP